MKIKLYPKCCRRKLQQGINEGWTNDHMNICDSCFEKEEEWKADAKEQWDKHEKQFLSQTHIELHGMLKSWIGFLMKRKPY